MPNILFISRAYGERAGGMERLSFELISEFKKNKTYNVNAIVHETKPGISLIRTRASSLLFAISVLPRAIAASSSADVVHIGDPVLSFVGWYIAKVKKKPIVVSVHGLDISYANPLYQLYLKLFFRSFSHYVPISDHAKQLLSLHKVSGAVTVIPPGVRDHFYDATKTKHDLEKLVKRDISGKTILATTGRLVARKGHEWFVRNVLSQLPKNYLYIIAGSGPQIDSIERAIEMLELADQVILLGRISNEDQQTLLNTIDIFIQPNIAVQGDPEGFGIAPLEAALCNRKVLASNIDGIPSAIHQGKNGVLLPSGDANTWIQAITASPISEMQPREYTLATFSWDTVIHQYERVFSE